MRPTALVTGGGRGIGRAIVETLAHNAWVAALDVQFPEVYEAAMLQLPVDVRDPAAVASTVQAIADERGGIDWVVCAAGIIRDRVSWKMADDDWDDVLAVNLTGAFHVARAVAPHLRAAPAGRLVFLSSINGLRGMFGQSNYAAAKAGLVGLARSLAIELARDGVTVNVIAPGLVDTEMTRGLPPDALRRAEAHTPLGRVGRPADVAGVVRFFCSDDASYITGVVLPVDGGQLLGGIRT
jgi:NAD(P)-dependent dehydrogenase (short-subunit alcohol dehydrogenase family)